jgi:hypothetical protein
MAAGGDLDDGPPVHVPAERASSSPMVSCCRDCHFAEAPASTSRREHGARVRLPTTLARHRPRRCPCRAGPSSPRFRRVAVTELSLRVSSAASLALPHAHVCPPNRQPSSAAQEGAAGSMRRRSRAATSDAGRRAFHSVDPRSGTGARGQRSWRATKTSIDLLVLRGIMKPEGCSSVPSRQVLAAERARRAYPGDVDRPATPQNRRPHARLTLRCAQGIGDAAFHEHALRVGLPWSSLARGGADRYRRRLMEQGGLRRAGVESRPGNVGARLRRGTGPSPSDRGVAGTTIGRRSGSGARPRAEVARGASSDRCGELAEERPGPIPAPMFE